MSVYPLSFSRIQTFYQCPQRFDYQYVTKSHKDAGSTASKFGNRVHEAFELYLRDGTPLPEELVIFQPVLDKVASAPGDKYYELQMAVKRDRTPCAWDDPECWIRGVADVGVVHGTRGTAADWKTGKPKEDTDQLKLMAALMFALFPELETVDTSYVWLYHKAPPNKITYARSEVDDIWRYWEVRAGGIDAVVEQGVYPAKSSGLCPWCPAYEVCPSARRR